MDRNPIEVIRAAEEEAKRLVEEARIKRRDARTFAQKEAEDQFQSIMRETDEAIEALKEDSYTKAEALTLPIREKAKQDARIIETMSDADLEEAVNHVVERMKTVWPS